MHDFLGEYISDKKGHMIELETGENYGKRHFPMYSMTKGQRARTYIPGRENSGELIYYLS